MPWPITSLGLLYDRKFFLVSTIRGQTLSQEQHPEMAQIRPILNLKTRIMSISSPLSPIRLEIPLDIDITSALEDGVLIVPEKAHAASVDGVCSLVFVSSHIRDFFSSIVGVECSLSMYCRLDDTGDMRHFKSYLHENKTSITELCATQLSNISPYSLISQSSVEALSRATSQKDIISRVVSRPHFVLEGNFAHSEEFVRQIRIGDVVFDVTERKQCHVVWIYPEKSVKDENQGDIYIALGKTRKNNIGGVLEYAEAMLLRRCSNRPHDPNYIMGSRCYLWQWAV